MSDEVTAAVSQPPLPTEDHADRVRRQIVWFVFAQFNLFVVLVIGAMVFRGWELSPTANNVIMLVGTAEINAIVIAIGFYLGAALVKDEPKA